LICLLHSFYFYDSFSPVLPLLHPSPTFPFLFWHFNIFTMSYKKKALPWSVLERYTGMQRSSWRNAGTKKNCNIVALKCRPPTSLHSYWCITCLSCVPTKVPHHPVITGLIMRETLTGRQGVAARSSRHSHLPPTREPLKFFQVPHLPLFERPYE
jgi:hypothetical protein